MRDDIKTIQAKLAEILKNLPDKVHVAVALEDMRGRGELFTFVNCEIGHAGRLFDCASVWCADMAEGFETGDFRPFHGKLH